MRGESGGEEEERREWGRRARKERVKYERRDQAKKDMSDLAWSRKKSLRSLAINRAHKDLYD